MSGRQRILLLVDEIKRKGLPPRTELLAKSLASDADVVLVAQCYLPATHRSRRPGMPVDLYGFPAEGYESKVHTFATDLAARHRPDLLVSYGWENAKLITALDALEIPIVAFVDYPTENPSGEGQLNRIFRHASEIVLHATIPSLLTLARYCLDAREFTTIETSLDEILRRCGWFARFRRAVWPRGPAAADNSLGELMKVLKRVRTRAVNGTLGADRNRQAVQDSGLFNRDLHDPDDTRTDAEALRAYVQSSRFAVPRDRLLAGRIVRRPVEGFNPLVYASDHPDFDDAAGEDPLAHWILNGRPEGRWTHETIRAAKAPSAAKPVAIHIHIHYPDLLPEFLDRLSVNETRADLFVTTTSDDNLSGIKQTLESFSVPMLKVCPNIGRDLWPFVELVAAGTFRCYDVVGHFHSKRSPHMELGDHWRDFLWSHLVGDRLNDQPAAMLDSVAERFAVDRTLGLVFAEEPHLEGWELNKTIATELAERAGIPTPLPNHFDYPMGTMFWIRPDALSALVAAGVRLDEMPPEPLAIDGTVLHALERLMPFVVAKAGYRYATTYLPGKRR